MTHYEKKPQAPCKQCIERHLGCHSTCEKYIRFKKEVERWHEDYDKFLATEVDYIQTRERRKRHWKNEWQYDHHLNRKRKDYD